jgi:hypothetical protein
VAMWISVLSALSHIHSKTATSITIQLCACLVHVTESMILDSNPKIARQKIMFGTKDLNEDSNPNLNFMWVPWQI